MRYHTGSGRRPLDTAAWNAAGTAAAATTFPAAVTVGPPPGDPQWNPETRQTEPTAEPAVYVDGPADITADAPTEPTDVVAEQVPERTYTVRLDRTHPGHDDVRAGHVVTVTASLDPALDGARLHVESVRRGDRDFARHLTCTLT